MSRVWFISVNNDQCPGGDELIICVVYARGTLTTLVLTGILALPMPLVPLMAPWLQGPMAFRSFSYRPSAV